MFEGKNMLSELSKAWNEVKHRRALKQYFLKPVTVNLMFLNLFMISVLRDRPACHIFKVIWTVKRCSIREDPNYR